MTNGRQNDTSCCDVEQSFLNYPFPHPMAEIKETRDGR